MPKSSAVHAIAKFLRNHPAGHSVLLLTTFGISAFVAWAFLFQDRFQQIINALIP